MTGSIQNSLQNIFTQIAPDKVFLNSVDHGSLTYGELECRYKKAISMFKSLDLPDQSRILIFSKSEPVVTTLVIAALGEGMIAVVADCESVEDEIKQTIDTTKPGLIVIDYDLLTRALDHELNELSCKTYITGREVQSAFPSLEAILGKQPEMVPSGTASDNDTALIVFTSGTTLKPKGVQLTFGNLAAQFDMFRKVYQFDPSDHIFNLLPLHHVDGLIRGVLAPLLFGASVTRSRRFQISNLPDIMHAVRDQRISHVILVPTILSLMDRLDVSFDSTFQQSAFKFIICSADHLNIDLWSRFEHRFVTVVVNSYGLSETVCDSLFCGPASEIRKIGTLGKPVDCEVRLMGNNGQVVAAGETGEIFLRGSHIMKGYFEQPDKTAEVIIDGWLKTGDLASEDAEGFFHFEGRKSNIIVTGGINIHPENINKVLLQHSAINEAATLGIGDDIWGQVVLSCVVLAGNSAPSEVDIMAHCRTHLPAEKTPHEIIFLETLPKVASGKTDMQAVTKAALEKRAQTSQSFPPTAPGIFDIAATCFKTPREDLTPDSTPYNTEGWDSLAHLNFITTLEGAFNIEITPLDIMDINSLEDARKIVAHYM
jgi:long-chain acyl-CoA synthetase